MDFITNLLLSRGHTVIWFVINCFTKSTHFIVLPTKIYATTLATRFAVEICRLHVTPKTIVSNRDSLFFSRLWHELFRLQGTSLNFSTSYHPQLDGQSEVVTHPLFDYLQCFVGDFLSKWLFFLHWVELWYNISEHSAINMSLFQALYCQKLPSLLEYVSNPDDSPNVAKYL